VPTEAPNPEARRWDERYAVEGKDWLERNPRPLLQDFSHLLPPEGLALDAAAGVANNGLFLARRGLRVIALDISLVGLRLAVRRARAEGVPLNAAVWDLSSPWLPPARFDVILNFRFLARAAFPCYRRALKPGGLLFFETFLKIGDSLPHPEYYLDPGELREAFAGFELIHYLESKVPENEHHPERGTARLVARKPSGAAKSGDFALQECRGPPIRSPGRTIGNRRRRVAGA
jgi:SAM-dependent methyltransferase